MFGIRRGGAILRMAEGDGGGTGGGAAEPFTEAQLAVIGQTVNSAITTHLKRSLPGAVAEGFKTLNIGETIATEVAKLAPPKPAEGDDDKGKGKGKGGMDPAIEQQLKDLATKLETSESARIAADKARVDAEQKRLLDGASAMFRNGLQPKLRSELLDVAVGHFGKELKIAEDGSPLIRVRRAPYKGAPEQDEDVPLAEGLPLLLASEGMKPFLPAPGGDGNKGKGGGAPARPAFGAAGGADIKDPAARTLAEFERLGISPDDI